MLHTTLNSNYTLDDVATLISALIEHHVIAQNKDYNPFTYRVVSSEGRYTASYANSPKGQAQIQEWCEKHARCPNNIPLTPDEESDGNYRVTFISPASPYTCAKAHKASVDEEVLSLIVDNYYLDTPIHALITNN